MTPQLDLTLEIVPAKGLGGFEVGRPLADYERLLRSGHVFDRVIPRVHGYWQVVYRISQIYKETQDERDRHDKAMAEWWELRRAGHEADLKSVVDIVRPPNDPPAIDLWVDVRDGVVDAVTALDGYQAGFGVIRFGTTYGEIRAVEPKIVERAFLDETTIEGVEGLIPAFG